MDPRESEIPDVGLIELKDAETGEIVLVNTSDSQVRDSFAHNAEDRRNLLKRLFSSLRVDHVRIRTDQAYTAPLMKFFRNRARHGTGR